MIYVQLRGGDWVRADAVVAVTAWGTGTSKVYLSSGTWVESAESPDDTIKRIAHKSRGLNGLNGAPPGV